MESNIDRYEDKTVEKVVDKKVLNKMIWRSLFLQASFNFERMQAAGWLHGLLPGLEKIHKNKEDLSKSMKQHMEFFNTHPFLVNFIQGIVISMEENKEDISTIRGIKVATMGPLGGIGDALFWLTFLPISAGIGAALALEGQIAGPIIFLVMFAIFGCTKRIYIPVTTTITEIEYRDKLVRDSIYFSDSVLIERKGDTVFNTKIKYKYISKFIKDTVSIRDSVYIEKPIEVVKEVNKLTKWQRWRLNFLWVLLAGGIGYIIIKIKNIL